MQRLTDNELDALDVAHKAATPGDAVELTPGWTRTVTRRGEDA